MESINQGEKDTATLERERDLASARFVYASQWADYWKYRANEALQEFNYAHLTYYQKKHGFTEAEIRAKTKETPWPYAEPRCP